MLQWTEGQVVDEEEERSLERVRPIRWHDRRGTGSPRRRHANSRGVLRRLDRHVVQRFHHRPPAIDLNLEVVGGQPGLGAPIAIQDGDVDGEEGHATAKRWLPGRGGLRRVGAHGCGAKGEGDREADDEADHSGTDSRRAK